MRFSLVVVLFILQATWAAGHVNILVYHHVSENTPASTSISPQKFRSHLQFFKDNGFTVISLENAIQQIKSGAPVTEKSIAITFDDGYKNIYDNAWPLLKEFNYPFTLFIATDAIDKQFGDMLSWEQLKEMKEAGVSIANHSRDHDYFVRHRKLDQAWLKITENNILFAQNRLEEELGSAPKWFAYPYGEFTGALKDRLQEMGYIAFAQHSGGLWAGTDLQAIPRFAAAGIYANEKTLLTKLNSRPMRVDESTLDDMLTNDPKPILNASLITLDDMTQSLNCFVDGQWQDAKWPKPTLFTLQASEPLEEGRHRYNCTSKSRSEGFYYWFSKPWLVYSTEGAM